MSEENKTPEPNKYEFLDYTYALGEDTGSPFTTKIKKGNITVDFDLNGVNQHLAQLKTELAPIEGQVRASNAMQDNITRNHADVTDFIKSLEGEKLAALLLYADAEIKKAKYLPMLAQQQSAIDETEAEIAHVIKVLGIVLPAQSIPSPYDEPETK